MTKIIDGSKLLRAIARSAAVNGATDTAEDLDLLAAAWEAERAEAQEIRQLGMRYMVDLASMTARATRAEAALEQLQDALSVRDHQYLAARAEIVAQRAALERARALAVKLRDGIDDYWGFCNPEIIADLAALLAAGGEQP